jgi:hypothetical protein
MDQDFVHLPSFKCNMGNMSYDMVARRVTYLEKNLFQGDFFSNSLTPNDPRLNSDLRGVRPDTNRQSTWSINISTVTHEQETALELGRAVEECCMAIKGLLMVRIRIRKYKVLIQYRICSFKPVDIYNNQ